MFVCVVVFLQFLCRICVSVGFGVVFLIVVGLKVYIYVSADLFVDALFFVGHFLSLGVVGNPRMSCCQYRPRVYIIGVKISKEKSLFKWPLKQPRVALRDILDTTLRGEPDAEARLGKVGQRNVAWARQKFQPMDIDKRFVAIDIGASPSRPNAVRNCLPCLTRARHGRTSFGRKHPECPL